MTVNRTLMKWNITRSLATGQTEIDTSYAFTWSDVCQHPYRAYFRLSADSLLVFTQPDLVQGGSSATLPKCLIRTPHDNATVREYSLFLQPIQRGTNESFLPDFYFLFQAALKPDARQAVLAMNYFPQIHLLDLATGSVKIFRLKGKPAFSADIARTYYLSVQCDDRHIYALYSDGQGPGKTIHVFDWDGCPVRQIDLGREATSIALDPVSGTLYAMLYDREQIYRYDL